MPSQNIIKQYVPGGYYHVYNRGVDKGDIFIDDNDYRVMLSILSSYLMPVSDPFRAQRRKDLEGGVTCQAYCLMPNHFHLLLKQENISDITTFMRCTMTAYVRYFNMPVIAPLFAVKVTPSTALTSPNCFRRFSTLITFFLHLVAQVFPSIPCWRVRAAARKTAVVACAQDILRRGRQLKQFQQIS